MGLTRPFRVYLAGLLALSVLVGCSGTTSEETEDGVVVLSPADTQAPTATDPDSTATGEAVRLIDAGSEPRVTLRISDDVATTIMVGATTETATNVGGSPQTEMVTASYELAMELGTPGDTVRLSITPAVTSMDAGEPEIGADELGTWLWRLDGSGELLGFDNNDLTRRFGANTAALLSTPDLVLVTPNVPVGPGAQWSYLAGADGEMLGVVTLGEITESDLHVTFGVSVEVEGGSLTIAGSGTYDRASLLVRNVAIESVLAYSSEVSANGELVELIGSLRTTRTYTEVSS